jgi:hypothetical protein
VVARGRWASGQTCWFAGIPVWVCPRLPRGSADLALRRVMGPSAPGEQKTERARLSCLLHWGPAPSAGERCCRTAGCERDPMPMQVATRLRRARDRSAANTVRPMRRNLHRTQCVCRQRGCARGVATAGQSSFSQLKLSENRRKQYSSRTTRHIACNVVVNAFQQYEWLARLATAKLERRRAILELAHPPLDENVRIHWRFTMGAC